MLLIGILEGIAEAVAGLSKGFFGHLSDAKGIRLPFVRFGYALSALSKPMMAAFIYPLWILFARTTDRLGKGIRTGARDAMLSDESLPETKARIFGFHRSLDTLGAVIGPLFALLFISFLPGKYRILFLIAFIPGLIAIILTFLITERGKKAMQINQKVSFLSFVKYWKRSPLVYKKLVAGLLVFTLFNSSDVFLLLKLKESGLNDTIVIGVYIFYNLVYAVFAFPLGVLADKTGIKKVFIFGIILFSLVYFGMAFNTSISCFIFLFFLYGIYAAATEGISKAWITNISDKSDTATAIGTYTAFQSIGTMIASSLAGLIWFKYGASVTFLLSGIAAFFVAGYVLLAINTEKSC